MPLTRSQETSIQSVRRSLDQIDALIRAANALGLTGLEKELQELRRSIKHDIDIIEYHYE